MDNAVILAEGVLGTTYGKTANGLIRYSGRYRIDSVIDSLHAGDDAGHVVSGKSSGIPVCASIDELDYGNISTMIIGAATDGGLLPVNYRPFIADALKKGISIVSGLHEFLSDDPEFREISLRSKASITDVRKLFRDRRDLFTGRIMNVESRKIAVLGTDSAVGKRTTAIRLNEMMARNGNSSAIVGTGQTSWMQGIPHTIVLDAIVNDFVPGALESVTVEAWDDGKPEYLFIEGQGSIMHPAYPGSFEIIGACRPDAVILQHAPRRLYYDGFPGFTIPPLEKYIRIIQLLSDRKIIGISLNTENMTGEEIEEYCLQTYDKFGIPVFDPLSDAIALSPDLIEEAGQ